jgi:dihydropteroate synthase
VQAGAHIVNDVWGLQREPGIARAAAETGAGLVVMHTGRERTKLADPIADQVAFLSRSLEIAREAGVDEQRILLDPGFGFAKETPEENLDLMARFSELSSLGRPWLVGTSRKRFVGAVTGREPDERGPGTAATSVILRLQGAVIFRVHDVAINKDALRFADAMVARGMAAGRGCRRLTARRNVDVYDPMKNCAFFARHGVLDEEETLGQRFYVDAVLDVVPIVPLRAIQ